MEETHYSDPFQFAVAFRYASAIFLRPANVHPPILIYCEDSKNIDCFDDLGYYLDTQQPIIEHIVIFNK